MANPYASDLATAVDAANTNHAVWESNGQLWHAIYDENAQTWVDANTVSNSTGGSNIEIVSGNIIGTQGGDPVPGLFVTYTKGIANDSEIYGVVGRFNSQGEIEWSDEIQITDDSVSDNNVDVGIGANGLISIVYQKALVVDPRNSEYQQNPNQLTTDLNNPNQDDTDIYQSFLTISPNSSDSSQLELSISGSNDPTNLSFVSSIPIAPYFPPGPLAQFPPSTFDTSTETNPDAESNLLAEAATSDSSSNINNGTTRGFIFSLSGAGTDIDGNIPIKIFPSDFALAFSGSVNSNTSLTAQLALALSNNKTNDSAGTPTSMYLDNGQGNGGRTQATNQSKTSTGGLFSDRAGIGKVELEVGGELNYDDEGNYLGRSQDWILDIGFFKQYKINIGTPAYSIFQASLIFDLDFDLEYNQVASDPLPSTQSPAVLNIPSYLKGIGGAAEGLTILGSTHSFPGSSAVIPLAGVIESLPIIIDALQIIGNPADTHSLTEYETLTQSVSLTPELSATGTAGILNNTLSGSITAAAGVEVGYEWETGTEESQDILLGLGIGMGIAFQLAFFKFSWNWNWEDQWTIPVGSSSTESSTESSTLSIKEDSSTNDDAESTNGAIVISYNPYTGTNNSYENSTSLAINQAQIDTLESDVISSITITDGGSGYLNGDNGSFLVGVSGGLGDSENATQAILTAYVVNGVITQIVVESPGFDYISAPTLDFSQGGGTGAQATPNLTNLSYKDLVNDYQPDTASIFYTAGNNVQVSSGMAWVADGANSTKPIDTNTTKVNTRVMTSVLSGTFWSEPVAVPKEGSTGFNFDPAVGWYLPATGTIQQPIEFVVWAHADASGINSTSTQNEVINAIANTELYYSTATSGGVWSNPQKLATTTGTDSFVALGNGVDGTLISAWVNTTIPDADGSYTKTLYTAAWDATTNSWSNPTALPPNTLANNQNIASLEIGVYNGQTAIYWSDTAQQSYLGNVIQDTPIIYYRLDEINGLTAYNYMSSGTTGNAGYIGLIDYNQTGALSGDPDTAIGLDGGYLEIPDANATLIPSDFSIEFWVKFDSNNNGDTTVSLVDKSQSTDGTTDDWYIQQNSNNQVVFNAGAGEITSEVLNLNQWYYVVATYEDVASEQQIDSVNLINGGSGYLGGGSGTFAVLTDGGNPTTAATLTATVTSGVITAITVDENGADYTSYPSLDLTTNGGGGNGAIANPVMSGIGLSSLYINSELVGIQAGDRYEASDNSIIAGENLDGALDELAIYNYALEIEDPNAVQFVNGFVSSFNPQTSDEITTHYNSSDVPVDAAENATFFSYYDGQNWIIPDRFSAQQEIVPTQPLISRQPLVDIIGENVNSQGYIVPDGEADVHLQLSLSAPGKTIQTILVSIESSGLYAQADNSSSIPDEYQPLAVVQGNKLLNSQADNLEHTLLGATEDFDLYFASDNLSGTSIGDLVTVSVTYTDGTQTIFDGSQGNFTQLPILPDTILEIPAETDAVVVNSTIIENETTDTAAINSGITINGATDGIGFGMTAGTFASGNIGIAVSNPTSTIVNSSGDSIEGAGAIWIIPGGETGTLVNNTATVLRSNDPTSIPLGGIIINGVNEADQIGTVLAAADINGDGVDDLIISAPFANNNQGAIYIIDGNQLTLDPPLRPYDDYTQKTIYLDDIDSIGTVINSPNTSTTIGFGWDLAIGDVNGDGLADIVIGAPFAYNSDGAGYIIYGNSNGIIGNNFIPELLFQGVSGAQSLAGFSVAVSDSDNNSSANGDSYGDILIGAPGYQQTLNFQPTFTETEFYDGKPYTINGDSINTNLENSTYGSQIYGEYLTLATAYANTGFVGNKELVTGRAYLILGSSSEISTPFTQNSVNSILDAQPVFAGDLKAGYSVSFVGGDFLDGDNTADIVIGAPAGNTESGLVFAISGDGDGFNSEISLLTDSDLLFAGADNFYYTGLVINDAGDVNGDGYDDLIIGSPQAAYSTGQTHIIFGSESNSSSGNIPEFITLQPGANSNSFLLNGGDVGDLSGKVAVGVGDVNNDGIDDMLLSAPYNEQQIYVAFGKENLAKEGSLKLDELASDQGLIIIGDNGTGEQVVSIGDINGDDYGDFFSWNNVQSGSLIFGNTSSELLDSYTTGEITLFSSSNGLQSIRPLGDFNGDSFDDFSVVIGGDSSSTVNLVLGSPNLSLVNTLLFADSEGKVVDGENGAAIETPPILTNDNDNFITTSEFVDQGLDAISPTSITDGVVLASFNNLIYAAFASTENSYEYAGVSSDGGNTWTWEFLEPDGFIYRPAFAVFNDNLYLASHDPNGTMYISAVNENSSNNLFFELQTTLRGTFLYGPALSSFNGQLYLLFAGGDNQLYYNTSSDGVNWSQSFSIDAQFATQSLSAATVTLSDGSERLVLAYVGENDNDTLYTTWTDDGENWTVEQVNNNTSIAAPTLTTSSDGKTLYLFFQGVGNEEINIISSTDGQNWTNQQLLPDTIGSTTPGTTNSSIGATVFEGDLYVTDQNNYDVSLLEFIPSTNQPIDGTYAYANTWVSVNSTSPNISNAGDLNGDGFDELVVVYNESSYVIYGNSEGTLPSNISSMNASEGLEIVTLPSGNFPVNKAGDVNGDGYQDLILGSYGGDYIGGVSILAGTSDLANNNNTDAIATFIPNSDTLFINPESSTKNTAIGDINGDGFGDIITLGYEALGFYSREIAFVVFGGENGIDANSDYLTLITLPTRSLFDYNYTLITLSNSANGGDLNGDGFDDVVLGVHDYFNKQYVADYGGIYILFGSADITTLDTFALAALNPAMQEENGIGDLGVNDVILKAGGSGYLNGGSGTFTITSNITSTTEAILQATVTNGVITSITVENSGSGFTDSELNSSGTLDQSDFDLSQGGNGTGLEFNADVTSLDGFLIQGPSDSFVGKSLSTGDDINGDGFDDITFGAPGYGSSNYNSSFVLFGGDFTASLNQVGNISDDVLEGTPTGENMIGLAGNDTLIGNGGIDALIGGNGDDLLILSDTLFRRVDGSFGYDVLAFPGFDGQNWDITTLAPGLKIQSIEALDLTNYGSQNLTINSLSILALSEVTNAIVIYGDSQDNINLSSDFTFQDTIALAGGSYHWYQAGEAEILIESDISTNNITFTAPQTNSPIPSIESSVNTESAILNPESTATYSSPVLFTEAATNSNSEGIKYYISTPQVKEDEDTATFTIVRGGDINTPSSAYYYTINDSAIAGQDYEAKAGILVFKAGETTQDIVVPIIDDQDLEAKQETFSLAFNPISTDEPILTHPNQITFTPSSEESQIRHLQIQPNGEFSFSLTTDKEISKTTLDLDNPKLIKDYLIYNGETNQWESLLSDGKGNNQVEFLSFSSAGKVKSLEISLVDGSKWDLDGIVNGIISHQGQLVISDEPIPPILTLDNSEVEENQDIGTLVGTFNTEGLATDEPITYELLKEDKSFEIVDNKLYTTRQLDFESKPSYNLEVKATDSNDISVSQNLIIEVINLDDVVDGFNQLFGTPEADTILGFLKPDSITGAGGDDYLDGGLENDYLFGNDGNDLIMGGLGNDTGLGGNGNDQIGGNRGEDILNGDNGNDTLISGSGNDVISGGDGDDELYAKGLLANVLVEGDDNLLYGGLGNDKLFGGYGNDLLDSGKGNDSLKGNEGNDTFVLRIGDGIDNIMDFTSGADLIGLDGLTFDDLTINSVGTSSQIIENHSNEILAILKDVISLNSDDFILVS